MAISFIATEFSQPNVKASGFDKSRILYEDKDLLAYEKPVGMVSSKEGVEAVVRTYSPTATLLHRLDKETTGVLLFRKNPTMEESLLRLFQQRQVKKTYLAIVDGIPNENEGLIENLLGQKQKFADQIIWGSMEKGSFASTSWKFYQKAIKLHYLNVILKQEGLTKSVCISVRWDIPFWEIRLMVKNSDVLIIQRVVCFMRKRIISSS